MSRPTKEHYRRYEAMKIGLGDFATGAQAGIRRGRVEVKSSSGETRRIAVPRPLQYRGVQHCPSCGQVVKTIFDHVDIECDSDSLGPCTAGDPVVRRLAIGLIEIACIAVMPDSYWLTGSSDPGVCETLRISPERAKALTPGEWEGQ